MHLVYSALFLIQNPGEPPVKALQVTEVQVVHAKTGRFLGSANENLVHT